MRFLHVSDTHLGHRRWNLPEREKDFYDVFNEVADIAIREKVEAILHAGDMFDKSDPPPQTYVRTYEILKKLKDHGIRFYVVAGNHEIPTTIKESPLRVFEKMDLLKILSLREVGKEIFRDSQGYDVEIYGYSKDVANKFFEEKLNPPNNNEVVRIALIHTLVCEPLQLYLNWSEEMCRDRGMKFLRSTVNKDVFNYIALGDLHIKWEGRVGESPAVYPGSTEALDRGEAFDTQYRFIERYVYLVEADPGETRYKPIKLESTRPWLYIETLDHRDLIDNKLREINWRSFRKPPILVISLRKKPSSIEYEALTKKLNELIDNRSVLKIDNILYSDEEIIPLYDVREISGENVVVSIDSVLNELFKDQVITGLLSGFIDEKISEEEFIKKLRGDKDLLNRFYEKISGVKVS
ncbi:MAG: metallophosphoesterase family protein [Sulfolobales archaeon]